MGKNVSYNNGLMKPLEWHELRDMRALLVSSTLAFASPLIVATIWFTISPILALAVAIAMAAGGWTARKRHERKQRQFDADLTTAMERWTRDRH